MGDSDRVTSGAGPGGQNTPHGEKMAAVATAATVAVATYISINFAACSWLVRRQPAGQPARYYTSGLHKAPIYFDEFETDDSQAALATASVALKKAAATKPEKYDVIVIGGELAGWVASYELAHRHLNVLDLESATENPDAQTSSIAIADGENVIDKPAALLGHNQEISDVYKTLFHETTLPADGGIASSGTTAGRAPVGRAPGAVVAPIVDSFDAYYLKGVFYNHLWNDDTLKKLPAGFAVFKQELKNEFSNRMVGNLPLENSDHRHYKMELDQTDAVTWIQNMPDYLRTRDDADSRAVYRRFHNENFVSMAADMNMKPVLTYMNLVCRARAGTDCRNLSALYLARLMLDSTGVRQPLPHITDHLRRLREHLSESPYVTAKSPAHVTKITNEPGGLVKVEYTVRGTPRVAEASAIVWTSKLNVAPDEIADFALARDSATRKQIRLMRALTYAPVMRYQIILNGRPFIASYQTWWQSPQPASANTAAPLPVSFFLPNFFDLPSLRNSTEVVTLVEPLPIDMDPHLNGGTELDEATVAKLADKAVIDWTQTFQGLFYSLNSDISQGITSPAIRLQSVHASRSPASVLIVGPGHFLDDARFLRRPFGHVYFGSPDIGAPTFEEAVFRAHCAVRQALAQIRPHDFSLTTPSLCPIDR